MQGSGDTRWCKYWEQNKIGNRSAPRSGRRTFRARAKFSSSGALFAKQRKLVAGRSQGPSPHPASSRDGDGAQNAAVLACCGLMEARTRVRARAAYKVRVCVQCRNRENVLPESAPLVFSCFSCPEMNARPRRGDSEVRFHCADVTPTLVQCHTPHITKRHQNVSSLATARRCRSRTPSRPRPSRDRFDSRSVRAFESRGGRRVSLVCFVRGLVLALSLALASAGQRRAAIAEWDHEPCGVSRGVGASRSRATGGRKSATVLVAHS